jgi:hypothetical protein
MPKPPDPPGKPPHPHAGKTLAVVIVEHMALADRDVRVELREDEHILIDDRAIVIVVGNIWT